MARALGSLTDRTRVVSAARVILPLIALGLMSMIFLLADTVDPSRAIDAAEIDVEDRARDPRISAARFAGVTDEGAALRIAAGSARSDPGATLRFQVQDFALWLDGADSGSITAQSQGGFIDRGQGSFEMTGEIRIAASPGYQLSASRISGLLDRTRIEVEGPVSGLAPAGRIDSGALLVTAQPRTSDGRSANRLVFSRGVRLIYDPQE